MTRPDDELCNEDELREMFARFQGPDSPSPLRRQKRRLGLSLALAVPVIAGATVISVMVYGNHHEDSQPAISSETAGVCAATVDFDGRHYYGEGNGNGAMASLQRGELLGTGIIPACNDSVGVSSDGTTTTTDGDVDIPTKVYEVVGIDPADAVMVEGQMDALYISESARERIENKGCWDAGNYRAILSCSKSPS